MSGTCPSFDEGQCDCSSSSADSTSSSSSTSGGDGAFTATQSDQMKAIVSSMLATPSPQAFTEMTSLIVNIKDSDIQKAVMSAVTAIPETLPKIVSSSYVQTTQPPKWIDTMTAEIQSDVLNQGSTIQSTIMKQLFNVTQPQIKQDLSDRVNKECSKSSTTVCDNAEMLQCTMGKDGQGECTFKDIKPGYTLYLPSNVVVEQLDAQKVISHQTQVTGELLVNDTYCCSGAVNAVTTTTPPT